MLRRTILVFPCLIALLIYLPSLRSGFVYDARAQILTDDYIHQPSHLKDVLTFRVLSQDVLDNDRPVHLAVYLVESIFWGRNPLGYHLTSILLHAGNVLLLTCLLNAWLTGGRATTIAAICAACSAVIYAVHPINVEPVAEPSYREDLLATLFTLAGLLLATRPKPNLFLIPLCFLLGIASKENAIVGPPVLLLYWVLYRRNESWKRWLILTATSIVVVIGFLVMYALVSPEHSHIFVSKPGKIADTFPNILTAQARIITYYFWNLVWPMHLSADYRPSSIVVVSKYVGWLVVSFFVAAQLALLIQSRLHLLASAIFWLGIATVCNIVPIYRPMADRFLYLPLTGIALHIAILLLPATRKRLPGIITAIASFLIAIPLITLTFARQRVFHDSIALWTDTLRRTPDSFTGYDNLAFAYYDAGDFSDAVRNWQLAYKLAVTTAPYAHSLLAESYAGLAIGLDALDHHSEASAAYQRAVAEDARFGTPQSLFEWERPHIAALQKIADRSRGPGLLSF